MKSISTHVLDISKGKPAKDVVGAALPEARLGNPEAVPYLA